MHPSNWRDADPCLRFMVPFGGRDAEVGTARCWLEGISERLASAWRLSGLGLFWEAGSMFGLCLLHCVAGGEAG